jgi:hypothetical protein
VELGHLYIEDFAQGPVRLTENFRMVVPWVKAINEATASQLAGKARPRISTCFLIDDYFTQFSSPAVVIPQLLTAATQHGLTIDYLAREAACAEAEGRDLAGLLAARLVPPPPEGSNGAQWDGLESGWLANGARSPARVTEAMAPDTTWVPPSEIGAHRHSIFLDAQLWDSPQPGKRQWSCPFLASVWQCLRLGLLRDDGAPVLEPRASERGEFPDTWAELPPLIRLNPKAQPFTAYQTFSILASRFLPIEHTVRLVLGHIALDAAVVEQAVTRAADEHIALSDVVTDRVSYVFTPPPHSPPVR